MDFGTLGFPELFILGFICAAILGSLLLVAWPAGRICQRVGFSPWLGILAVLPFFNLVLLWYVALSDWPNLPRPPRSATTGPVV